MKHVICAVLALQVLGLSTLARVLQTASNATQGISESDVPSTSTTLQTSNSNDTGPQETNSSALSSDWGSCRDSLCDPAYPGAIPIHIYDEYIKV